MCWHNASGSDKKNEFRFHLCTKIRELFYKVVDKDAVYGKNKKGEEEQTFDDAAAKKYFSTLLKRPTDKQLKVAIRTEHIEEEKNEGDLQNNENITTEEHNETVEVLDGSMIESDFINQNLLEDLDQSSAVESGEPLAKKSRTIA